MNIKPYYKFMALLSGTIAITTATATLLLVLFPVLTLTFNSIASLVFIVVGWGLSAFLGYRLANA